MEIIVSLLILSLVLVGLLNVFVVGKKYIVQSRSRISAAELGRRFLDPLQQAVRADTWDNYTLNNNSLLVRVPFNGTAVTIDNIVYTPQYTIENRSIGTSAFSIRKVQVNITWNEPSP